MKGSIAAIVCALAILALAGPAWGTKKYWVGGNGNWTEADKWSPTGVPDDDDLCYFDESTIGSDYTVTINTHVEMDCWKIDPDGNTWGAIRIGTGDPGQVYNATVELLDGGSIGPKAYFDVWTTSGTTATFHQKGGTIYEDGLKIGKYGGGTGYAIFKVSGGTIVPSYRYYQGKIENGGACIGGTSSNRQGTFWVKGSQASIKILGGEDACNTAVGFELNTYGTIVCELDENGISPIEIDTSVSAQLAREGGDNACFYHATQSRRPTVDIMKGTWTPVEGASFTVLTADYIDNGENNDILTLTDSDRMPSSEWSQGPGANYYWKLTVNNGTESGLADNNGDNGSVVVQYLRAIDGDANLDDWVDDSDLSLLLTGWGTGTKWDEGDFNDDDIVNDSDLSILLTNWGGGAPSASSSVPEPATLVLLGLGGLALIRRRRK